MKQGKVKNLHNFEHKGTKCLELFLEKWVRRLSLIRLIDECLQFSYILYHPHLMLHVASVTCYSLSSPISVYLSVCLSTTTCWQGNSSPIPLCLRPSGPTSAFVSQHHGALHLQHCAIHHRSQELRQHPSFGEAELRGAALTPIRVLLSLFSSHSVCHLLIDDSNFSLSTLRYFCVFRS